GKTGLGIALLEEALIDNLPVIAIDPKGDLTNLVLNFPQLRAQDLRPWVNEQDALNAGLTPEQFAAKQADLWRKGLGGWGQDTARIARLKDAADFAVYTPGSSAGLPVSVLRSFAPPPSPILQDTDLLRERIQTTATSLLALLGMEADPITSREHILVSNILESTWAAGKALDLAGLIRTIQTPPFERIGVMDLDAFYPAKERFQLAMRLNNLLAAPGFEAWLEGDPLNINRMLFMDSGKPRASIFTISHLSDAERMFFVSMLLNEILAWMRTQAGTSSLRAILYMDEIFGYFPPVKNPPSKAPLLTLLKQARAFGLGVVLSTQNPVDLDYKGLSNTGSWFIGRLQTERDKERVLAGLEGAAAGSGFNRGRMEEILAGLGKRVFLLNNVHENEPVTFETRWVLSYLRGPLTREQIKVLMADKKSAAVPPPADLASQAAAPSAGGVGTQTPSSAGEPPVVAPGINVMYLAASGAGQGLMYYPAVAGWLDVYYSSAKYNVDAARKMAFATILENGPVAVDWDQAEEIALSSDDLQTLPLGGANFAELPSVAEKSSSYKKWNKDLLRWVRQNRPLTLYRSKQFKLASDPEESRSEFLSRVTQAAREKRDLEVEKLRRKYSAKYNTLQRRLMRAEQALQREQEQAKSKKMETMVSFGTAILGAFLGRKAVSAGSATRFGTAVKSAGRMRKESMDVARAQETAAAVKHELAELDERLQRDIDNLDDRFDPAQEELEEILIKPQSTNIAVEAFGLTWMPYRKNAGGRLAPDWRQ
ncbi:MAG: ATP-binding protein, partial [Desulfobacterales bacterium]